MAPAARPPRQSCGERGGTHSMWAGPSERRGGAATAPLGTLCCTVCGPLVKLQSSPVVQLMPQPNLTPPAAAAALAFLEGPSTHFWVAVVACTVVMRPSLMPASWEGAGAAGQAGSCGPACQAAREGAGRRTRRGAWSAVAPSGAVAAPPSTRGISLCSGIHCYSVQQCMKPTASASNSKGPAPRTKGVVHNLGHGRQAIGGARGVGQHLDRGVVLLVVHALRLVWSCECAEG